MGKPGGEYSPYEIFSRYTVWLSIRRLKEVGLYKTYIDQYNENLERTKEKHEIINLNNEFKKMLYNAADPFFTWERAVGMCPVCFGFWVSLFTGISYLIFQPFPIIYFAKYFVILLIIIVTSNIFIRLINKLL